MWAPLVQVQLLSESLNYSNISTYNGSLTITQIWHEACPGSKISHVGR